MRHFLPFATVILLPGMLDAQGKLVKFGDSGLGDLAWLFYIVLAAMILVPAFYLIKSRSSASGPSKATKQKKAKVAEGFKQRAAALGFTVGESRTLERIALRLTPKTPQNLLITGSGQEFLMADLDKRIHSRQREMRLLEKIKEEIFNMHGRDVHERESVRVEADMPIWVVKKSTQAPEEAAPHLRRLHPWSKTRKPLRRTRMCSRTSSQSQASWSISVRVVPPSGWILD